MIRRTDAPINNDILKDDPTAREPASEPTSSSPNTGHAPEASVPRTAAIAMAALGGHVFPCHTPREGGCSCGRACGRDTGKHPRTANGLLDASTDPATIGRWWRMWRDANVAVRTGAASGIVVIDIDSDGFEGFEALCSRHGAPGWAADSWTVATGGGGLHLYLEHPGLAVKVKTTAGVLAPGVDVRGDGGYALIPPSLHASGNRYCWADGCSPWDMDLAPIPPWLLPLLIDPPRPPRPGRSGGRGDVVPGAPIPAGERNATLTSLAGSMRRAGFGEASIAAALKRENAARCHPPLDDDEVAKIATSVARYTPEPTTTFTFKTSERPVKGLRIREVRRA